MQWMIPDYLSLLSHNVTSGSFMDELGLLRNCTLILLKYDLIIYIMSILANYIIYYI